jgi:hypothetical protein
MDICLKKSNSKTKQKNYTTGLFKNPVIFRNPVWESIIFPVNSF